MTDLPALPFIEDGDGYSIRLSEEGRDLRIIEIERFDNNQNSDPIILKFFDLPERVRQVVLLQIRRRYPQRSVRI